MNVAPSFVSFEFLGDPFEKNGKMYVHVRNPKTKTERDVRVYSDTEYAKAYPNVAQVVDTRSFIGLKKARGFENGPILVVRRNLAADEEWLRQSEARYAVGIGWYFTSSTVFPKDAPPHFKYLLLRWDEFRDNDDNHMKSEKQLAQILDEKARRGEWVFDV